MVMGCVAE